jgi:hypothetical protein
MRPRARSFVLVALVLAGCSGTGQPGVSFLAVAKPAETTDFLVDDVTVSLTQASVAFGPAYFCASASGSSTLCEAALGEVRSVTVIDLLRAEEQPLGTYEGLSGVVRSASFDYGIHWFLPESEAHASPEAPSGHSARLAGTASRAGVSIQFEADVDVVPLFQGQRAVPTAPAMGEVGDATGRLEVGFDVAGWLGDVDFAAALAAGDDPWVLGPGMRDHDAIVIRMVSTRPPTFGFAAIP